MKRHEQKLQALIEDFDRCLMAFHAGDAAALARALEDHIVRSFELRDAVCETAQALSEPGNKSGNKLSLVVSGGKK